MASIKKFPKVDDGTIYKEITKFIKNSKFTINVDEQISLKAFQKIIPDNIFVKIADCVLNLPENFPNSKRNFLIENKNYDGKIVDYLPVPKMEEKWKTPEKEWIYTILYDGKIMKIGMTSSGMYSRFSSYNTGTKKAMLKGSCATTNFVISQSNFFALTKGMKVEIYAYEIPMTISKQVIFGRKEAVLNKVAHHYEYVLIDIFKSLNGGKIPFLCGQSG